MNTETTNATINVGNLFQYKGLATEVPTIIKEYGCQMVFRFQSDGAVQHINVIMTAREPKEGKELISKFITKIFEHIKAFRDADESRYKANVDYFATRVTVPRFVTEEMVKNSGGMYKIPTYGISLYAFLNQALMLGVEMDFDWESDVREIFYDPQDLEDRIEDEEMYMKGAILYPYADEDAIGFGLPEEKEEPENE